MGQKCASPKLIPDHSGGSNKCFWPILSPWGRALAHEKFQLALKRGYFGTKNGSKMGQKHASPKMTPDHLGGSNKCFWPSLSPWGCGLPHGKSQIALKRGRVGTKNGSKMGQKWVKNALLQNSSWIIRGAQTSVFGPFCTRGYAFWPVENPNLP